MTFNRRGTQSGHFSHANKSRIFTKADRKFHGNFLKNHFRHLNYTQIPKAGLPEIVVMWTSFEIQKIEVHIFERTNLSGFGTWKITAKEDLSPLRQVFLLNLRLCPVQKPKIWPFFHANKFTWENSVAWKLGAFGLKISTLPRLLVVAIRVAYLVALTTMA